MGETVVGSNAWKAQDKGLSILVLCWTATVISTFFVVARIYVQHMILGRLHVDDYFVVLSNICGYIATTFSTVAVLFGNGNHFSLLTTTQQQGAILWTTASFCPGVMSFGLPKLAVVALLTRLLNPSRSHKWFLWIMGFWCQLTLLATVGVLLGRCTPARSLWDFSVEGKCLDTNILIAYCIYAGSYSAFVDIYLAIYPAVVLFKLQIPLRKKLLLSIALGVGSVSGAVAIYKTTRIPDLGSQDFSYDTSNLVIWTVIEGSTIIIACSIPILQPLLRLVQPLNPFGPRRSSNHGLQHYEVCHNQPNSDIGFGRCKPRNNVHDNHSLGDIMNNHNNNSQEDILTHKKGLQSPVTRKEAIQLTV